MRVAIIGAGPSGLASIKSCIEENHEPVCFERENSIGGVWNFTEDESHSSVYRSTAINTSKEMSCFSDFPVPEGYSVFMSHKEVIEYLQLYSSSFNLSPYITFNTTVIAITKTEDYSLSGKWQVKYHTQGSDVKTMIFDAVMVCTGHHWYPSLPSFPGLETFQGRQLHSHSFKDTSGFENKTVLVVGFGNSAADIATELSHQASQAYLSTRRGGWVISRLSSGGLPWDFYQERRIYQIFPTKLIESLYMNLANGRFDHENFGIRPKHGILNAPTVISDEFPYRVANGTLKIKPNISHFTETGVVFDDGTAVENLDAVVFCTGYKIVFKFLSEDILSIDDNQLSLFKYVYPPDLPHSTLSFIGLTQSSGSMFPLIELQTRWVTRVMSGKSHLPSRDAMVKDIQEKKREMENTFIKSKRCTIQVSSIAYRDEIAEMIGCKPSFWKLLLSDPFLALLCYFGPCTPSQYRLTGPGTWSGAKKAIKNTYTNMYPKTQVLPRKERSSLYCMVKNIGDAVIGMARSFVTEAVTKIGGVLYSFFH